MGAGVNERASSGGIVVGFLLSYKKKMMLLHRCVKELFG